MTILPPSCAPSRANCRCGCGCELSVRPSLPSPVKGVDAFRIIAQHPRGGPTDLAQAQWIAVVDFRWGAVSLIFGLRWLEIPFLCLPWVLL